jgi:hypothetical protein
MLDIYKNNFIDDNQPPQSVTTTMAFVSAPPNIVQTVQLPVLPTYKESQQQAA